MLYVTLIRNLYDAMMELSLLINSAEQKYLSICLARWEYRTEEIINYQMHEILELSTRESQESLLTFGSELN